MKKLATVFRRIGGRIIPIRKRISGIGMQDEVDAVKETRRARRALRNLATESEAAGRKMYGAFFKSTKARSLMAGRKISKRISRLSRGK